MSKLTAKFCFPPLTSVKMAAGTMAVVSGLHSASRHISKVAGESLSRAVCSLKCGVRTEDGGGGTYIITLVVHLQSHSRPG